MHKRATIKIVIGIQARSTSTRFPRKVHAPFGDKTVLKTIIDTCIGAKNFIVSKGRDKNVSAAVAVCVPYGDDIVQKYSGMVDIVEGPEHDVLTRYMLLADKMNADYIVRITSDCPLIYQNLISQHVLLAINSGYDYVSNVDEECRTAIDGLDCEVISYKLLKYTADHATDAKDREHVTTFIRNNPTPGYQKAFTMGYIDQSSMKRSVDTPEELERALEERNKTREKLLRAQDKYGPRFVHRF